MDEHLTLDMEDRRILSKYPIGRAYIEYYDKIGGKAFGYNDGMPVEILDRVDNEFGGVVGLYHECIRQGKSWEELLDTDGAWEEIPKE